MGKECLVINPATGTSGSQSIKIDGKIGIVTFGRDADIGIEKDSQAQCVLANWFAPENYKRVRTPNVRDCGKCTRRVGFKPLNKTS